MHSESSKIVRSTILLLGLLLYGCANRVAPDGGPFDDTPPRLIKMDPVVGSLNVSERRFTLTFDEYVTLKDMNNKIIISPPQLQRPTIISLGKKVVVELQDSLIPNSTYTIDFTDAVVDNNENNPLENFSVAFSTGSTIDTMEMAGTVLNARNHEPVNGILVGIHPADLPLSTFTDTSLLRASRTSDLAHFVIRNIAPGSYRLFALKESDNNYRYDFGTEGIAYLDSALITSSTPALRNDTIWVDSLTIDTINQIPYTRYLPDDVVLLYSEPRNAKRFISKRERPDRRKLEITFNTLPDSNFSITPLDSVPLPKSDWYMTDADPETGILTLYLTDTLAEAHTRFAVSYPTVDSLLQPITKSDTITLRIPKVRTNEKTNDAEPTDSTSGEKPKSPLSLSIVHSAKGTTRDSITFSTSLPIDTTALSAFALYDANDTILKPLVWKSRTLLSGRTTKGLLVADLRYGNQYEIQVDSTIFKDIYGNHLEQTVVDAFKVEPKDQYTNLEVILHDVKGPYIGELLDDKDKPVVTLKSLSDTLSFKDLQPGKYGFRVILDRNANGQWDPADFTHLEQPEAVYYAPKTFELMKNWEIIENFYPLATPLLDQKPRELIQNKPKEKKKEDRNAQRERERQEQAAREASISSPVRF